MFDKMLNEANVVITPGSGFGAAGEGYFRISAFNSRANAEEVGAAHQGDEVLSHRNPSWSEAIPYEV